jgi:hypothetical protein
LMLALLEKCVTDLGGTYAMEDTDSMAIIATESGGLVPCAGGPFKLKNGAKAIKAVTWNQVEDIAKKFESLNPYDRDSVPGSILKIVEDNFDPETKKQRQIWCLAISAKRYALFLKDECKTNQCPLSGSWPITDLTRSANLSKPQRMSVASLASQIRTLCELSNACRLGSPIMLRSPAHATCHD